MTQAQSEAVELAADILTILEEFGEDVLLRRASYLDKDGVNQSSTSVTYPGVMQELGANSAPGYDPQGLLSAINRDDSNLVLQSGADVREGDVATIDDMDYLVTRRKRRKMANIVVAVLVWLTREGMTLGTE